MIVFSKIIRKFNDFALDLFSLEQKIVNFIRNGISSNKAFLSIEN